MRYPAIRSLDVSREPAIIETWKLVIPEIESIIDSAVIYGMYGGFQGIMGELSRIADDIQGKIRFN